jgi:cytochrome c oxidase cbb3-type subunit III
MKRSSFLPSMLPALLLAPLLAPLLAAAQSRSALPPGAPSAEQMLGVQVGGTHIPRAATPQLPPNPYEGNADAVAEGRQLFHKMHCVECHAPEGGGGMGPPLSDQVWIYGGEPAQIYLTILQGRPNGMPAFGAALPPDAIWKLVSYVRTLSAGPTTGGKTPPPLQSGKP